jgi:ADP-ribosyl-[dinitrogen reductase] hydrolase
MRKTKESTIIDRYRGILLRLAIGEAVGTTLEFKSKGSFVPINDMKGGGPFNLTAGEWTDDTSMALCLATSLIECGTFNAKDQMQRYCCWWRDGYLSSNGRCFDIGITVSQALAEFEQNHDPYAGSTDPYTAGNGSLMRLAPIPLRYMSNLEQALLYAKKSSEITHAAEESVNACQFATYLLIALLKGDDKKTALEQTLLWAKTYFKTTEKLSAVFNGSFLLKDESDIKGSGYVVESLEAALWAFYNGNDYKETILLAANLGDDADTTAAIAGQFAGALYGEKGIPCDWLEKLVMKDQIADIAVKLSHNVEPQR